MKRSMIIILAMVLTLCLFAGCRRKTMAPTTEPMTMPTTMPTTAPTTAPTTRPTTAPTTMPTVPTEEETIEGGLGDTQETNANENARNRRAMPKGF